MHRSGGFQFLGMGGRECVCVCVREREREREQGRKFNFLSPKQK